VGRGAPACAAPPLRARAHLRAEPVHTQVLVNVTAMPINAGDLYNVKMGATPYSVRRWLAPSRQATQRDKQEAAGAELSQTCTVVCSS
jgi:hypothetical protein